MRDRLRFERETTDLESATCLREGHWAKNELPGALKTLERAHAVQDMPRVGDTLRTWFARLYTMITHAEIALARGGTLRHPAFLLRFIRIFYGLYDRALTTYLTGKLPEQASVAPAWRAHFGASGHVPLGKDPVVNLALIGASLSSGVSAHVQHDMEIALRKAFVAYRDEYCLDLRGRALMQGLHTDFFAKNKQVFKEVRQQFMGAVLYAAFAGRPPANPSGTLPDDLFQFAKGYGFPVVSLDVDNVYRWRQAAWDKALRGLV